MTVKRYSNESGVALITALLAVMLMSALMVGMFAALATDQRSHAVDRDQTQAYAAAQAGLEKLTSGLAQLFVTDVSPSVAQINAVASTPPAMANFEFTAPGGAPGSGYSVTWDPDVNGNPLSLSQPITTGPFTGFNGLITKYRVTTTAVSDAGAEVRLRREIQTVAIPVFQFGVFSESDLTFYAGDDFSFGGRVHTNGNLFACEFAGTMTFTDRITAVREAIHNYFSNGLVAATYGCSGVTNILTAPGTFRNWKQSPNEGSVTGMPGSAANANWATISTGTYKSYIRTGATGAKRLDLPLVSQGATPVDLIRRPALNSNENVANPPVFGQRYFAQASLRVLLSDRAADITGLPTVTAGAPVQLTGDWRVAPPGAYGPVDATHPPIARSPGPVPAFLTTNASTYAGGLAQIYYVDNAATLPALYKVPQMSVNVAAPFNINCTGKTASSFTGCTAAPVAVPNNTVITANVNGIAVQTTITPGEALNATTYRVAANSTGAFSWNELWMNNPNATVANTAVPVSCQGYTEVSPRHFINCSGLTAAPANNTAIYATSAATAANTATIGGFIKIEKQDANAVWSDVTMEILNLGIGAPNLRGTACADPTPNAILRIQRLHDNGGGPVCSYPGSVDSYNWWPNTLYDTREGQFRDVATTTPMNMGGVMQYIALDTRNLARWFSGNIGATGGQAVNNNGYIVYFSDRRGNHDGNNGDVETGEYGFEDQVNPAIAACCSAATPPNGALDGGEDMNGSANQQIYGQTPWNDPAYPNGTALAPYTFATRPWTVIPISNTGVAAANTPGAGMARVNKVLLFRRALKLINGGIVGGVNNLPPTGLTVASENPVYVQGNYNATTDPSAEPNVPASVIADSVTLLSNNWNDAQSFEVPTSATSRNATTTGFRFAAVGGKGISFQYCAAGCGSPGFLFGTDGGVGNFLRLLEDWNIGGVSINYRGSLVTLHTSRQAIGTFKYNTNVYDFGARNFTFDVDFLTPSLLPPGTPMFRDVNTLKFRQILRPNQ